MRRALVLFTVTFVLLFVIGLFEGDAAHFAAQYAAQWALISAAVFVLVQLIRDRLGMSCEVCEHVPAGER